MPLRSSSTGHVGHGLCTIRISIHAGGNPRALGLCIRQQPVAAHISSALTTANAQGRRKRQVARLATGKVRCVNLSTGRAAAAPSRRLPGGRSPWLHLGVPARDCPPPVQLGERTGLAAANLHKRI